MNNTAKIDAQVGQKVEYKANNSGRGRPTKAYVLDKTARTLTVIRTTNNEVVKIKAADIVRIVSKIRNTKKTA